ncbi:MAG: allophanate hydrolase, partial [Gammaproteobacteria bacterium]|nr:allophanate hydrolase [Gammaproteobacteria bacterium]
MSLLIERAGALASLQDGGRMGVRHLGVTQGGPVDWISHSWANWLLGNPVQAATVEITLGNFSLRAQTDTCLAICGADLGAALDDEAIAPGRSFEVRKGQLLAFAHPKRGVR